MISLNEYALILGVNAVATCIFVVVLVLILRFVFDWNLIKRVESCERAVAGGRSQSVRGEKAARLNEAAIRAAELFKAAEAGNQKPNIVDIGIKVGMEYPDVAIELPGHLSKMAKKLGIRVDDMIPQA